MIRPLFLLLAGAVAACGPLVQVGGNAPPPAAMLVLRSDAPPPQWQGPAALADTLGVMVPDVPAELQTLRLPVQIDGASVQYLVGAAWSEQPSRQFQRLISDRLAAAGVPVLDTRSGSASPARTLTGHLREFGLDVRSTAMVRVRYDAQLAGPRSTGTVALKSFVAEEPVASQQPAAVAAALSRASNRLAGELAAWIKP